MPYSDDDKAGSKVMKSIYREIATGTYSQPADEHEKLQNLDDCAEMESAILQESADKVKSLLKSNGDQQLISQTISSASSAIEGLDEIIHLKSDLSKGKTPH